MSKKNQDQIQSNHNTIERRAEFFVGPLPPPDVLAKYNEIIPGSADRIFTQFEEQSRHRRNLEQKVITSDIKRSYLGLIFGFIIGLLTIGSAVYLIMNGKELTGGILGTGGVAGLVSVFVYGSKIRNKELQKRQ